MRRMLIATGVALLLVSNVMANGAPRPRPTTKSTAPTPKLESEPAAASQGGSTLLAGAAISLAVVSGGLMVIRRRGTRSGPEA